MRRWIFLIIVLASLGTGAAAHACPMCKDSIENKENGEKALGMPAAYNYSVYWMLAGLIFCTGLVVTGLVRAVKTTSVAIPPDHSNTPRS